MFTKQNAGMRRLGTAVVTAGSMVLASSANAASAIASPDLSAVTDAATGVGLVGVAVFGVVVLIKGFGWIRRAL